MTGAAITMFLVKLVFLLSLINIVHSLKRFGKSLKSNCEKELSFSLGFLIFRYSQALQTSSQIQEVEGKWRRQMISEEISREEFDSPVTYSPEEISRDVSQKKKNRHQKGNKKRSKTWGHDEYDNNNTFLEPTRSST